MSTPMTREDVERIVAEARDKRQTPDLSGADLRGADLSGADLRWADLLRLDGLPSGQATLVPTCHGWVLSVGCWTGTVQGLRDLIAGTDWPEAKGDEQDKRRPGLSLLADLCEDHIARHPDVIDDLTKRWGDKDEQVTA